MADNNEVTSTLGGIEELFRRLPVALYRSAPDGALLAANPAFLDLLGYDSFEQLSDENASVESFYVDGSQREEWLERIVEAGEVLDFDLELRRRDGSTVWVQDTARAVFGEDGDLVYCEGGLIDMNEKVKARQARDEFVATVSHELRNPLSVLLGLAHELANDYESFSDAERKEIADVMARQAEDASWLIEDLLVAYREDVSRVTVLPEPFDVGDEVRRVLETVEHPVGYEPEHGATHVYADPRRTRQILRNLISNAVRYGGDEVKVATRRSGDRAIDILVCDDGDPLDPEDAQRIFESYVRGRGRLDPRSVGLGLSVARKLAGLMGGEIVYAHDGGYSSFIVTLPSA
ncbi:MAG TPA: PAS domain-containing sensor histidine kinase [Acidimicrobiia bacterium]|nr:PAS domain-containing sensor histidine kinase [Acidimicrobiia bacterium]